MMTIKPILAGIALAVIANSSSATTNPIASLQKQLEIMEDIMRASVVEHNSKNIRIPSITSTYLKGQGAVFTFNIKERFGHMAGYNFSFSVPDFPEVPEIAAFAPDVNVSFDENGLSVSGVEELTTNALEVAAESFEQAMEQFHEKRADYRSLREAQRDLEYQVRDLDRELRDLNFQQNRANKEEQAELAEEKQKLEQKRKTLVQEVGQMREKSQAFQLRQNEEKQAREKIRNNYYAGLSNALAETLCLYGNGLRALPKNERVSIILKSAGEKSENRYKDQIYVFNKNDINQCSIEKITSAQLLSKGQGYQF